MFRTILAATEAVGAVTAPLACAAHLARRHEARLIVVHVAAAEDESPADAHLRPAALLPRIDRSAERRKVRKRLEALCAQACGESTPATIEIAKGRPWVAILQAARRHRALLAVIGAHRMTHGTGDDWQARPDRIGSTAEGVIRHASCPIMIVNRPPTLSARGFRKVLVGIDFSATCELALNFAAVLARHDQAALHVFHMMPVPPYPKYSRGQYANDKRAARRRLNQLVRAWRDDLAPPCHLWGGSDPQQELLKCAAQLEADLLVLGSHTRERESQWYAGSTAVRAGLRSPCPVVVISGPEALAPWFDQPTRSVSARPARERRLQSFQRLPGSPNKSRLKSPRRV